MAKLADSKYVKVKITFRNPDLERPTISAATNRVIENGNMTLKSYRIKPGAEVELPEPVVDMLSERYYIVKDNRGKEQRLPMYFIERV